MTASDSYKWINHDLDRLPGLLDVQRSRLFYLRRAIRLRACTEEARELDFIFLRDSQISQPIPVPLPAGLAMVTFPDDPGQDLEEVKLVPIVEEDLNLKLAPNSHVLDRMNEQARLTHILDETSMRSITGLPVLVGELDWDSRTLPSLHRIVSIFHGTPYLEHQTRQGINYSLFKELRIGNKQAMCQLQAPKPH